MFELYARLALHHCMPSAHRAEAGAVVARRAAALKNQRDVPYLHASPEQKLDLVFDLQSDRHVIVFIHGGAWQGGDKRAGRLIQDTFLRAGYAFASINYRLAPGARVSEAASDVAAAVAHLVENAGCYRLRQDRVILLGHSAGAQLAALVTTDHTYLEAVGVAPRLLPLVVLLDGAALDAEQEMARPGARRSYGAAFGDQPAMWRRVSPIRFAIETKLLPYFCIYFAADNLLSRRRALPFARAVAENGAEVRLRGFAGKTHGDMFRDLANADDPLSAEVVAALSAVCPVAHGAGD
ncbi:MAG TPA: alpha/beta hydrolase [Stellaceae bacterium]|nr:alpha/beta hydrolase [Stellaceae bacterium]